MKNCLFIGGPYARQVLQVADGLERFTAVEFPAAGACISTAANPHKTTEKLPETHYQRGQISDASGKRHDVFVAPDVDAIQELMRGYAQGGAK